MKRDIFSNVSPLDHRYYLSNMELADSLREYLSENAYIRYELKIEAALVKGLARVGICSEAIAKEVEEVCNAITPEEVYEEEKVTKHNIRALVNCIQNRVSPEAKPFVHLSATSVDIMDSASSLRYKEVCLDVVIPTLVKLEKILIDMAMREKATIQIGRTHGQHAVPVTFGFAISEYVSRLGQRIIKIREDAGNLRGKISGACGAYNASSLLINDPLEFEKYVLASVGIKPSPISTQIVEAEYLTDLIHSIVSTFGVIANLADDIRHLIRTEIGEVAEYFDKNQVGSSTMPHKRNPWNFEHVKSMWKEFMPRMNTLYIDQISEHQRDLSNSASARFVPEIIVGFTMTIDRLTQVMSRLGVDKDRMVKNFNMNADMIIAEPLYIMLASMGHPNAHEVVRRLTLEGEKSGKPIKAILVEDDELKPYYEKMSNDQKEVLNDPRKYTGIAEQKTEDVCNYWRSVLNLDSSGRDW